MLALTPASGCAAIAALRVDSGPSVECNATRILSATKGCLCLTIDRLSAPTGLVRCLSNPGRTQEAQASKRKMDSGNFLGTLVLHNLLRHLHNLRRHLANPLTKLGR